MLPVNRSHMIMAFIEDAGVQHLHPTASGESGRFWSLDGCDTEDDGKSISDNFSIVPPRVGSESWAEVRNRRVPYH